MRSIVAVCSLISILAGCGYDRGNGVTYPGGEAATITLSVASTDPLVSAGETRSVTAVVKDANGYAIAAPSLSWRTSAPAVATVEGSGASATITAVDDGTATITASSGNAQGTVTITVRRRVVAIEVSAPEAIIVEGFTTQLAVVGRDARQQPITGLTGITFATDNAFSVMVSPTGLVTALFSSFQPTSATVTASLARDAVTLSATTRITVASAAPPAFDFFGRMDPADVRPGEVNSAADGIVYFTLDGPRVRYQIQWSLVTGTPTSVHIHGPDNGIADTADVLVDLALGNQPDRNGTSTGSFSAADIHPQGGRPPISLDSLVALIRTPTLTYADMHTTFFADGEMRSPIIRRREARVVRMRGPTRTSTAAVRPTSSRLEVMSSG
jgi:hypothetical protein